MRSILRCVGVLRFQSGLRLKQVHCSQREVPSDSLESLLDDSGTIDFIKLGNILTNYTMEELAKAKQHIEEERDLLDEGIADFPSSSAASVTAQVGVGCSLAGPLLTSLHADRTNCCCCLTFPTTSWQQRCDGLGADDSQWFWSEYE